MTTKKTVKYELATHHGSDVILILFHYDAELIQQVKLSGARWSKTKKAWYVPDSELLRERFGLTPKENSKGILPKVYSINQAALDNFTNILQLKAYSRNTIKTYRNEFAQLLYVLKNKHIDSLDMDQLRSYFLYCLNQLKLSENTLHSRINAIKF